MFPKCPTPSRKKNLAIRRQCYMNCGAEKCLARRKNDKEMKYSFLLHRSRRMFLREDEIKADGAGVGESVGGGRAGSTWFFLSERLDGTLKKKKRKKNTGAEKQWLFGCAQSYNTRKRRLLRRAPSKVCTATTQCATGRHSTATI